MRHRSALLSENEYVMITSDWKSEGVGTLYPIIGKLHAINRG